MLSPSDPAVLRGELDALSATYITSLESAAMFSDGDHDTTAKVVLNAYHVARDGIAVAFSRFEYPKDVHREFLRSVLRYNVLNPAFLAVGRDKNFREFARIVHTTLPELKLSMASELHEYASLLETTPREYMLATVGAD